MRCVSKMHRRIRGILRKIASNAQKIHNKYLTSREGDDIMVQKELAIKSRRT